MAIHNIKIRKKNGAEWDTLYPLTLASNVTANSGKTVQHELDTIFFKTATPTRNGAMSYTDKSKIDGIEANANRYIHPNNSNTRHVTDTQISAWNDKYTKAEIDDKLSKITGGVGGDSSGLSTRVDAAEKNITTINSKISSLETGKANTNHNHDSRYVNKEEFNSIKDQIVQNKPIIINNDTPIGTIVYRDRSGIMPDGWLKCDGRELSTIEYPDLFAIIGYKHGGSDNVFKLPNVNGNDMVINTDKDNTVINNIIVGQVAIIKAKNLNIQGQDLAKGIEQIKADLSNTSKQLEQNTDIINKQFEALAINVKKLGAKGDGVTNDDLAIQEADSRNGILFFPKGRYILSNPPASKAYGVGATLVVNDGYEMELDSKPLEVNSKWQTYIRLNNTDLGISAGKKLTPESYGNVAIGNNSMKSGVTNVIKNVAIGHNTLGEATNIYQNTAIGTDACRNTILAERNTVVGSNAGIGMGDTIIVGRNYMFREDADTSELDRLWPDWRTYAGSVTQPNIVPINRADTKGNTAIGRNSMGWTIKPIYCTAVGYNSLEKALEGAGTVAIGVNSSYNTLKSNNSVTIGFNSNALNSTSNGDVSIGAGAMNSVPHSQWNVAIGYQALHGTGIARGTTISDNIAIGRFALGNTQGETNSNVAVGASALRYNQEGFNTAIGQQASQGNRTGRLNTAIGCFAGRDLTTASSYTALGYNALNNVNMDGFTNITGVGQNSTVTGSNQLQLGNSAVNPYAFNALQLRSDRRDKLDIEETSLGLDFINKLRPVEYRVNFRESYIDYDEEGNAIEVDNDGSRAGKRKHLGLIAQELKEVMDDMSVDYSMYQDHKVGGGKDVMSIGYEELIAPIIKAIQELTARVNELEINNQ